MSIFCLTLWHFVILFPSRKTKAQTMNNFQYLTINNKGSFVGGKPTKFYQGHAIVAADVLPEAFRKLQEEKAKDGINIQELRFLASETEYKNVRPGATISPSGKHPGPNAWYCYVLKDGTVTKWHFYGSYTKYGTSCALCGPMACLSALSGFSLQDLEKRTYAKKSMLDKIKNIFTRQK